MGEYNKDYSLGTGSLGYPRQRRRQANFHRAERSGFHGVRHHRHQEVGASRKRSASQQDSKKFVRVLA
jgi:hypothetical protein